MRPTATAWAGLDAESGTGRDHRRIAGVEGGDIDRVTPSLVYRAALDDVQRDAFVGKPDGVGVAQLVGAKRRRTWAFEATRRSWARAASLA